PRRKISRISVFPASCKRDKSDDHPRQRRSTQSRCCDQNCRCPRSRPNLRRVGVTWQLCPSGGKKGLYSGIWQRCRWESNGGCCCPGAGILVDNLKKLPGTARVVDTVGF